MARQGRKSCFVIMPFGDKLNIDNKMIDVIRQSASDEKPIPPDRVKPIKFDTIYTYIIEKAAGQLDLDCIRCDKIAGAGSIHEDMFRHIWEDDVAIVDISTLNANVFYELGIRHTLHRKVTVLIQREGTTAPFNIQGYRVITYDETDLEIADNAVKEIVKFVRNGLKGEENDSPVYKHLPDLQANMGTVRPEFRIIETTEFYEYALNDRPDVRLGLVTGDIRNLKHVDVWVNSENRNMQMARYYDPSMSGTIRWLGAKKKPYTGQVLEDTIALELAKIMGNDSEVEGGLVIPTSSGQLLETNRVKKIFHAAAVEGGQPGKGYRSIPDIGMCIVRALELIDREGEADQLESIAFPLMGTGTGGGSIENAMKNLVKTCLGYLKDKPATRVKKIYFLAPIQEILQAGFATLDATPGISKVD